MTPSLTPSVTPSPPIQNALYAWGYNGDKNLGLGDSTNRSSPVQVGALTNWNKANGSAWFAIVSKQDGTLWGMGQNNVGQLGLGFADFSQVSSPTQIGSLTGWSNFNTGGGGGNGFTLSTKTDGTIWSWGRNTTGQLGDNTAIDKSSPVQIGALSNWSDVSASSGNNVLAVKTDGTIWAWGSNTRGQLGVNDTITRSSPVQIGALTNWSNIAAGSRFSIATKTDGTLWAWGENNYGQLGLGNVTNRSSPVQVGTLTNWLKVAATGYHVLAIKTDATMWSWGNNGEGRLGLNDTISRSSPVQIGALNTWSKIDSGGNFSIATKQDRTMWTWGDNTFGRLGLGDVINRSSPVQVGASAIWDNIGAGDNFAFGITTNAIFPTPSVTPSRTPSRTPSVTPSITPSRTPTPSPSRPCQCLNAGSYTVCPPPKSACQSSYGGSSAQTFNNCTQLLYSGPGCSTLYTGWYGSACCGCSVNAYGVNVIDGVQGPAICCCGGTYPSCNACY